MTECLTTAIQIIRLFETKESSTIRKVLYQQLIEELTILDGVLTQLKLQGKTSLLIKIEDHLYLRVNKLIQTLLTSSC